jgi:hypothetical protein
MGFVKRSRHPAALNRKGAMAMVSQTHTRPASTEEDNLPPLPEREILDKDEWQGTSWRWWAFEAFLLLIMIVGVDNSLWWLVIPLLVVFGVIACLASFGILSPRQPV